MSTPPEPFLDNILFFSEDIDFPELDKLKISHWIRSALKQENAKHESINVIFCSDEFLLRLNKEHLNHDYFTDIITFQYEQDPIEGELYISLDRVIENARTHKTPTLQELHRVIIHGVLHMVGYGDKTKEEKMLIREKEDYYLKELQ